MDVQYSTGRFESLDPHMHVYNYNNLRTFCWLWWDGILGWGVGYRDEGLYHTVHTIQGQQHEWQGDPPYTYIQTDIDRQAYSYMCHSWIKRIQLLKVLSPAAALMNSCTSETRLLATRPSAFRAHLAREMMGLAAIIQGLISRQKVAWSKMAVFLLSVKFRWTTCVRKLGLYVGTQQLEFLAWRLRRSQSVK